MTNKKQDEATKALEASAVPNDIKLFFHCGECLKSKPADVAPREWVRIEVGWTKKGLQVWCVRHNRNVASLDFLGQKVTMDSR